MGFVKIAVVVLVTAVAIKVIPSLLKPSLPKVVDGFTAPGWEPVGQLFRKNVETGVERGGAFAVYYKGELVVDYTGGYADEEAEWAWGKDTLTCVFSSTKGASAVITAMLVDRGLLEYDKPVATFWPEFAQNGKERITVRQIMSHSAGLAVLDEPLTIYDSLHNPKKVERALAMQKPMWEPGTQHGYHGLSIGLYVDQFVRKVDPKKRDIAQFFREEIAEPYGVDFFIGLPPEQHYRCARLYQGSMWDMVEEPNWDLIVVMGSFMLGKGDIGRVTANPQFKVEWLNSPEARMSPCGASRGHGTARGLAKLYSILANGGELDGKRLLSRTVLEDMTVKQVQGIDRVLLFNLTYASGVNIFSNKAGTLMFGTPGAGGNMGFADYQTNVAWAYVTNHHRMVLPNKDRRVNPLVDAVYDIIARKSKTKRKL